MSTRGMELTLYSAARSTFSEISTLPTFTRPANCPARLSMTGDSLAHGPQPGPQKSTSTGWLLWATSCGQFSEVNSITLELAMTGPPQTTRKPRRAQQPGLRGNYQSHG